MEHINFTYVNNDKLPEELVKLLSKAKIAAIDTEADSLHHYFHKVCLIQLNVDEHIFIIDPFTLKKSSRLFELLKNKILVMHGGDYDIRVLKRDFGFIPYKIFDTMLAMQVLGYQKLGLSDLVNKHFGVTLVKGPQKMDWSIRPLPEKMLVYAANDVYYLIKLYEILSQELASKNRLHWAEENCHNLINCSIAEKDAVKDAWRIKGSFNLKRCELAYLKELWKWREEEAKSADIPVFKIFKNEWLIELAEWCCANKELPLSDSPLFSLISPWRDRAARAIRAVNKVREMKHYNWPKHKKPTVGDRKDVFPEIMESLKQKREELSQKFEIDPSFIINQKQLTSIASIKNEDLDTLPEDLHLYHWQKELFEKSFIEIIKNELAKLRQKKSAKKAV